MKKFKLNAYLVLSLFLLLSNGFDLKSQVNIDTSAIPLFWELVDTLKADQEPSKALWERFGNHPAYVQIQKSGNRVSFLKRVLPLVFMPSNQTKLADLMKGPETPNQYFATHIIGIKGMGLEVLC